VSVSMSVSVFSTCRLMTQMSATFGLSRLFVCVCVCVVCECVCVCVFERER